jgi:ABC-type dipeptide/oligopeptide/nickel transport system permease component
MIGLNLPAHRRPSSPRRCSPGPGWPADYEAIFARDYPVLMGILIVIGITVVVANILTDIAYSWLDPRVRYQ